MTPPSHGNIIARPLADCIRDALSRHVVAADQAIALGSITQPGGNPYLNVDLLVRTAQDVGADAIHPGYGYLSENPVFSDAAKHAGLLFIGPNAVSMSTLGDKRSAKTYLRKHAPHVPLIPGFTGSGQAVSDFEEAAESIGYPIMLKASAGGGGKGMRIVRQSSDLREELERVQSEAARFFGSADCILEKYVEAGKHIEIQIIGDSHGNVVSLWERECSVQRRHQKVIEETPSPWLTPEKRQAMSDTAVQIGKLLGYENAGTVEFVFDVSDGNFYFLEVNTRLQVEHPITEEVTRLDMVALQLFVAAGGSLASLPVLDKIPQLGHAIECRLCAEDPQQTFYPEHGTIRLWKPAELPPSQQSIVRYETAVETGSNVSIHFDSMIAKIVVWAPTRAAAIAKAIAVLANTVCAGVRTNQLFLQSCLGHASFADPSYTTSFIPQNLETLLQSPYFAARAELASALPLAACYFLRVVARTLLSARPKLFADVRRGFRNQIFDPVAGQKNVVVLRNEDGGKQALLCLWRFNPQSDQVVEGHVTDLPASPDSSKSSSPTVMLSQKYNAVSNAIRSGVFSRAPHEALAIENCRAEVVTSPPHQSWICASLTITIDKRSFRAHFATESCDIGVAGRDQVGARQRVLCHIPQLGTWVDFSCYSVLGYFESMREDGASAVDRGKTAVAPMPCKVLSVLKSSGEAVKPGESVMVVESMKMEMTISLAAGGTFEALVNKDDAVEEGVVLCRVS
jgi:acetyl/propionyl-CoA carboxylase alpha subunit